jgi:hypothetical protein
MKKGGDNSMTVDYKLVKELASQEVKKEETDAAMKEYKVKLKALASAEVVVSNLKRELEDLDDKYATK